MFYYIEKDNKIVLADTDCQKIIRTLEFMPQYKNCEIKETDKEIENFMFVDSPEWAEWKATQVREQRDIMIASYIWQVQRYDQQNSLQISTTDSAETYKNLLLYIQSLRDLTKDENFPNVTVLSFEDWIADKQETIDDIFS